jgi:alginate O-acetyltransferase complex protein AlgI
MVFNSFTFAFFFLFVLVLLPWLNTRRSNLFLLAASVVFYAAWDARFLLLIAFSTLFNFSTGQRIAMATGLIKRRWVQLNIAVNLGVLGFFKYYEFFADNLNALLTAVGVPSGLPVFHVILPLAISFYTFHCISYVVDVYRGHLEPASRLTDFALYLMLFPHLVAGPIVRASHLLPQIAARRKTNQEDWNSGLFLILWGLYKKVVVADNLAPKADRLFALSQASAAEIFLGTFAFAFQIYADFSGYTDMARGTARLMGFHFDLNFKFPYLATNPSDFWQRWHISLSQWLRDYLYIPLGGNRCSEWRVNLNLMLTMLIGGLWHGAAWNFVLWGGYHGCLLCLHRAWSLHLRPRLGLGKPIGGLRWQSALAMLLMFAFTLYGWLLFRASSLDQVVIFTQAFFVPISSPDRVFWADLIRQAVYFMPMMLMEAWMIRRAATELVFASPWLNACFYVLLVYAILFLGAQGGEQFIYFNF